MSALGLSTRHNQIMKTMRFLLFFAAFATCSLAQNPLPSCPAETGAYYLDGSTWKPLAVLSPSSASDDNGAHGMFTFSRKNIVRYPGAAAQITLPARPKLCTAGMMADVNKIFLVRLTEKTDHREIQVSEGTAATAVKIGYHKEDLQPIDVTTIGSDALVITPKQNLPPGQYLLAPQNQATHLPDPAAGYEFGVK